MEFNYAESWNFILFFISDLILIPQDSKMLILSSKKFPRCVIGKSERLHMDWPEMGEVTKLCRPLQTYDMKNFTVFSAQLILTDEFNSSPISEDKSWYLHYCNTSAIIYYPCICFLSFLTFFPLTESLPLWDSDLWDLFQDIVISLLYKLFKQRQSYKSNCKLHF